MIRYLNDGEKADALPLYRQAFFEDSEAFIEYYFSLRIRDNRILVDEEEGEICAMLHLNPYRISMGGRTEEIDYIVAVATELGHRRQGRMSALLQRSFLDMYDRRRPFVYLLPANAAYYTPFDFVYISKRETATLHDKDRIARKPYRPEDGPGLQTFLRETLAAQKKVYCLRDESYMEGLFAQLSAESGEITLFFDDENRIVGERITWGEKKEEREFLIHRDYGTMEETAQPYMMGRIIHLPSFLVSIALKKSAPWEKKTVAIHVSDGMIKENTGHYLWEISKEGSRLLPSSGQESFYEFSIGELTNLLFGCRSGAAPYPREPVFSQMEVLENVYLNEAV